MATKKPKPKASPSKPPKGSGGGGVKKKPSVCDTMDSETEKKLQTQGEALLVAGNESASCVAEPMFGGEMDQWWKTGIEHLRRTGWFSTVLDVDSILAGVIRGINQLRHLQKCASSHETEIAAGRALADITSLFLYCWPKDAPQSVTEFVIAVKKDSVGFQKRWDEIHKSGRPKEKGFAKGKHKERHENDELIRDYIWDVQHAANWIWGAVLHQFLPNEQGADLPLNERGERMMTFIKTVALIEPERKNDRIPKAIREAIIEGAIQKDSEYWKKSLIAKFEGRYEMAEYWLHHAINDHFDCYWQIVIEPLLSSKAWEEWASQHTFKRQDTAKERLMSAVEKSKLPPWKPYFSNAKKLMKPLLQEIMNPGPPTVSPW